MNRRIASIALGLALAGLAVGCSSSGSTSSAPTAAVSTAPATSAAPAAAPAVTAADQLKADGYGLLRTNQHPDAWVSSQACGLSGQHAEEVVIVRPDASSQKVAQAGIDLINSKSGGLLSVSYANPVLRVTGTWDAFTTDDLCDWK